MIVQLRMRGDDHGVFLIKRGKELVAQLRFYEEELKRMRRLKDSALSSLVEAWKEKEYQKLDKKGERKSETLKIGDLKPGLKGVRARATVVEKSEPMMVDQDGRRLLFSLAVVTDGTGTIEMPLWGRRAGMVSVGDIVLVEGVRVEEHLGELQLLIGRGKLTVKGEN
jgi:ssDNA-binding replication factor A large subunit